MKKKSPISQWKLSLHDSMGSGWLIGFMAKKKKKKKKMAYRALKRINYRQDLTIIKPNMKKWSRKQKQKTWSRKCKNTKYTMKGSSNMEKIKL